MTRLLAGVTSVVLAAGAAGQELLQDPGLEASTGASQTNPFWTLDVNMPAGTAAQFQDAPWASNPNGEAGIGLWFQAFQGSEGNEANASLHQTVAGDENFTYTLTAFFKRETNFTAGSVVLAIDFLQGTSVLQTVGVDLLLISTTDGTWNQFEVQADSPFGTDGVRVRGEMIGGVNANANPQSAMLDDFSLTAVPKVTVPVESLIGFYSFDDPGDPLADVSGSGNDLLQAFPDPADPDYSATGGFRGGAFTFDGQQRLTAPIDIGPFALPDMSMGAWVRAGSLTPGLYKVLGTDNGGWDRTIGLDHREPASPDLFRYTSFVGMSPPLLGTPGPVNTTDWTFLAVVYTTDQDTGDGTVTVYVDLNANSTSDDLVAVSGSTIFGEGTFETSIGSRWTDGPQEGWVGAIDNVFFYDVPLTAEQLEIIRDAGTPAPSEGDDPDLVVTSEPPLDNLPRDPHQRELVFGIRNAGPAEALQVSAVNLTGADAADHYSVSGFPDTLAPGESGAITLTFDSLGQVGEFVAQMEVVSNDQSEMNQFRDASVSIMAIEPRDPALDVLTDPVFGDLPVGAGVTTRTVEIQNSGATGTLVISSVELSGSDAANFTVDSFSDTVEPGATGAIQVTLDPGGAIGGFAAQLDIVSTDSGNRFASIDVSASIPPGSIREALLGFYPFDDPADLYADQSGNGNALELGFGAEPFYEADGGFEGGAYDFVGSPLVAPIDIGPSVYPELTMGAFVKPSIGAVEAPNLHQILGTDDGGWDRTLGLDNRPAESAYRYTSFVGNGPPLQGTPGPVNADDWTFVAATYDEGAGATGQVTVYVDLDASTTEDDLVAVTGDTAFGPGLDQVAIGGLQATSGTRETWEGFIDNVFFYGVVLSPAQLADIRTRGRDAILGDAPVDSRLWFTSIAFDGGGNVVLEWDELGAPGPYLVERFDNAAEGWAELGDGVTEKTFTDTTASGASDRLYRVSQE